MRRHMKLWSKWSLVLGLLWAGTAPAQTIAVGSASGSPGGGTTPVSVPLDFTRNAAAPVADFAVRVNYTTANLDATAAGANGGSCSVNDGLGFVTVLPPAGQTDLASNTYCNITFTIAAGAPTVPACSRARRGSPTGSAARRLRRRRRETPHRTRPPPGRRTAT